MAMLPRSKVGDVQAQSNKSFARRRWGVSSILGHMDGALSVVPWTVPFQWSRFFFEKATNNQVICGASVRLAKAPAQVFRLREKRISPSTTREARNLPIFSLEFVEGVNCCFQLPFCWEIPTQKRKRSLILRV